MLTQQDIQDMLESLDEMIKQHNESQARLKEMYNEM